MIRILGGDDFDEVLIHYVADEFQKEQGIDLRKDTMALQRLQEACEKAKKELSSTAQTDINLPFITADQNGPKHLQMTITRAKFEELADRLVRALPQTGDAGPRRREAEAERHRRSCSGRWFDSHSHGAGSSSKRSSARIRTRA